MMISKGCIQWNLFYIEEQLWRMQDLSPVQTSLGGAYKYKAWNHLLFPRFYDNRHSKKRSCEGNVPKKWIYIIFTLMCLYYIFQSF